MALESGRSMGQDELLEKLDQLVNRGRPSESAQQQTVPVLTDTLPETATDEIPTLTDSVSGPGHARSRANDTPDLEPIVATRLSESVDREIVRLASEFPAHRPALGELRKVMMQNLPELFRKCWETISGSSSNPADAVEARPVNRK